MENTLITQDRLNSLVELCSRTPLGAIVEVGVYKGGSLKYLAEHFPDRYIIGFDTFEGLPKEQWTENEVHMPGDFSDTTISAVAEFISRDKGGMWLRKGLFPKCLELKDEEHLWKCKPSFIHIDTDFYLSIKACLEYFWPSLPSGSIIALDDFEWPNCPGVKQALEEFGQPIQRGAQYQAYIVKP